MALFRWIRHPWLTPRTDEVNRRIDQATFVSVQLHASGDDDDIEQKID